jgi:hypothetical protein
MLWLIGMVIAVGLMALSLAQILWLTLLDR